MRNRWIVGIAATGLLFGFSVVAIGTSSPAGADAVWRDGSVVSKTVGACQVRSYVGTISDTVQGPSPVDVTFYAHVVTEAFGAGCGSSDYDQQPTSGFNYPTACSPGSM